MGDNQNKVQGHFNFFMKDFEPNPELKIKVEKRKIGEKAVAYNYFIVNLPDELKISHPYIVFIIFVHLQGYKFNPYYEKVFWEIPVKYKDKHFVLKHQKFGFQMIAQDETEESQEIGREAAKQIKKAIPFAEKLIEPKIKELVQKGKITLDNHFHEIYNKYQFFREKAEHEFYEKQREELAIQQVGTMEEMVRHINKNLRRTSAGNNYVVAMMDSYFSLIEHIFVLFLPFVERINFKTLSVEEYIGMNWKEKLFVLFDFESNKVAQQMYNRLHTIKEHLRNPLTHGYFEKKGKSFFVQMDYLGGVPMVLTKSEKAFKYGFGYGTEIRFEEIITCFDEFMKFLEDSDITKYGYKYLDSGLPVSFSEESRKKYRSAMTDEESFDHFVEAESHFYTNAMNMDW